jgi:hypothetical protein
MLPREFVEEWLGRLGATSLHIFVPLADTCHGFFVVLTLRFEVFGQDIVEGVSSALPAPTSELLQLH